MRNRSDIDTGSIRIVVDLILVRKLYFMYSPFPHILFRKTCLFSERSRSFCHNKLFRPSPAQLAIYMGSATGFHMGWPM